jgi:hypothetical protein
MPGLRSVGKIGTLSAKSPAGTVAKAPPPNKTAGRPLPNLSTPTVAPQGPAFLHLGQKRRHGTGGPGPQPPDFPGSGAEWVWFWASRKLYFNVEHIDPHQVPYDGGLTWQFADPIAQGISSRRLPAESTPDFIYESGGGVIIVSIEGFFFHAGASAAVQARDLYLRTHTGGSGDRVVRVNDGEYMSDVTGSTAIRLLADILANRPRVGQLQGGTVQSPRYANFDLGV